MTITIHSPFRSSPRISREGFIAVLNRVGSYDADPLWGPFPRNARPDVAYMVYDTIVEEGGDPAVYLAICGREHTFGTNQSSVLWRNETRSWGNQRSIRHPDVDGEVITDSERRSDYAKFVDVRGSARDAVYRVNDSTFAYANATTIAEVINIWAPRYDNNNPDSFARYIADRVTEWQQEFPPEQEAPMDNIRGIPFRVSMIPRGNSNRPGHAMTPEWITVHDTGNPRAGANAEMHRRFVNQGGGTANVSWHYTVDDKEIIQHLPLNENGWHAGDGGNGTGNRRSIGIELCVNSDGNWDRTMRHAAILIAYLQEQRNIANTRVVQHNHWSGKNCSARLRANGGAGWRDLLTMVAGEKLPPPNPEQPNDDLVINGKRIIGGMRGRYEALGDLVLPTLGLPRTEEFTADVDEVERTVQVFERGVLAWYPAGSPHGVSPNDPMHVRCLTLAETQSVLEQAMKQGVL